MESTSLSSTILPFNPISDDVRRKISVENRKSSVGARILASRREGHDRNFNYGGRLVDENMIVLRKRIHEMKMIERNYEPPSDWMEWEKRWYTSYDSNICEAMGFLQSQLMNTRPSFAVTTVALTALSVPTATALILSYFMEISQGILAGIHLG